MIRGCYASLTSILTQLSQLGKDFIDLSRLLAQVTSTPSESGGAFLHNHFLDEMRAWSAKVEGIAPTNWASIREKVSFLIAINTNKHYVKQEAIVLIAVIKWRLIRRFIKTVNL